VRTGTNNTIAYNRNIPIVQDDFVAVEHGSYDTTWCLLYSSPFPVSKKIVLDAFVWKFGHGVSSNPRLHLTVNEASLVSFNHFWTTATQTIDSKTYTCTVYTSLQQLMSSRRLRESPYDTIAIRTTLQMMLLLIAVFTAVGVMLSSSIYPISVQFTIAFQPSTTTTTTRTTVHQYGLAQQQDGSCSVQQQAVTRYGRFKSKQSNCGRGRCVNTIGIRRIDQKSAFQISLSSSSSEEDATKDINGGSKSTVDHSDSDNDSDDNSNKKNEIVARRIIVKGDVQGGYYRSCVLNEVPPIVVYCCCCLLLYFK
jgi:hypothetical protein